MLSLGQVKTAFVLIRNLLLALLLYVCIFALFATLGTKNVAKARQQTSASLHEGESRPLQISEEAIKIVGNNSAGLTITFSDLPHPVTINPNANTFNRPPSTVHAQDAYLGIRPHPDTEVYFPNLLDACRGSYEDGPRIRKVAACIHYLSTKQGDYMRKPAADLRASSGDPRLSPFYNSDGHGNLKAAYPSVEEASEPSKTSSGVCAGPVIPFHVHWERPVTWRLELFIKSFLHTQNIPCSRLHVWLFDDRDFNAANHTLNESKTFRRFLPLVTRGDIVIQQWRLPERLPMRYSEDNTDGLGYTSNPAVIEGSNEIDMGHGLVMDRDGQQWLTLSKKQLSYLPALPLDFMRLVTLHLYGGVHLDADVILLRDLRPLAVSSNVSFAMRHNARVPLGEFNPAVMSMKANSTLTSYLLRGGVRMGMNFHSLVLGMMSWKDGRNQDLLMLENSLFNPLWPGNKADSPCTTPCHEGNTELAFSGRNGTVPYEWRDFGAKFVRTRPVSKPAPKPKADDEQMLSDFDDGKHASNVIQKLQQDAQLHSLTEAVGIDLDDSSGMQAMGHAVEGFVRRLSSKQYVFKADVVRGRDIRKAERRRRRRRAVIPPVLTDAPITDNGPEQHEASLPYEDRNLTIAGSSLAFSPSSSEEETLREMGIIGEYDTAADEYPPNNRTLENFYKGAYSYQINGEWDKHPEPNSWIDVICRAHDAFLSGSRPNMYGEYWAGPKIKSYNRWPEYL